ncbi:hypothetical protein [Cupriavidus necator]
MPAKTSHTQRLLGSFNTIEMDVGLDFLRKIFSRAPQNGVAFSGENYSKVATEKEAGAEFTPGNGLLSGDRYVNAAATALASRSGPHASPPASLPVLGIASQLLSQPNREAAEQGAAAPGMLDIPGTLVAHALEEICGDDRQRASAAVRRLKVGSLPLERMEIPSSPADQKRHAEADAYRLAQILARSETGYALLLQWRPEYRSDDWQIDRARHTLLKATDQFLTTDAHSASTTQREHPISWHAAHAAQKLLRDGRHDPSVLTQIERTDFFSFNQGFTSDEPGSPLHLAQQRMNKATSEWLPRATTKPEGVVEVLKSKIAPVFGARKNPFDGLRRFGTSAHNNWPIKVQESFDKEVVSAVTSLEAIARGRITGSLQQSRAEPQDAADGFAAAARHAEYTARLAYWKTKATPQPDEARNTRAILDKPSLADAHQIIGHAQQLLRDAAKQAGLPAHEVSNLVQHLNTDPNVLRRDFVPDFRHLQEMAAAMLGEPGALVGHRPRGESERSHVEQFEQSFAAAEKIHSGNVIRSERDLASISAGIKEFYKTTNVGNSAAFADGGVYGLNGARLAIPVGHGVFVAPDVQLSNNKSAVVGLASSMYGGSLFLGKEHKVPLSLGATSGIGHAFGDLLHLGVSVGAAIGTERTHRRGLSISAPIQFNADGTREKAPSGDEKWRVTMGEVTDFLTDQQHAGKDAATLYADFANRFFNERNISVRWQDDVARKDRASLNVGAGARLYTGAGSHNRIGPMASAGVEFALQNQQRSRDVSGRFTRESSSLSHATQGNASLTLVDTVPDAGQVCLPSPPLVGTSTTFGTTGQKVTISLTREVGRYAPLTSNRTVEYRTPDAYLRAIEFNKASWIALLGEKRLNAHIEEVKSGAFSGKNRTFCEHYFLRADVARRLDELQALRESHAKRDADRDQPSRHAKTIEKEIAELLADEASWQKMGLFGTEATGKTLGRGLKFMLQAEHERSVSERRELFWLAPEMEELVRRSQQADTVASKAISILDRGARDMDALTAPAKSIAPRLTLPEGAALEPRHGVESPALMPPQLDAAKHAAFAAHNARYARSLEDLSLRPRGLAR